MLTWLEVLVVAGGGALGAVLRFLLSRSVEKILPYDYPWGIFVCNILGSLAIGVVAGLFLNRTEPSVLWRAFIIIGILGGFTTFSSFSLDVVTLWRSGSMGYSVLYILSSLVVCVLATMFGMFMVKQ